MVEHATENRSVGGSIPPLGTILQIVSRFQTVVSGPRCEGRLLVREPFVLEHRDRVVGLTRPSDVPVRLLFVVVLVYTAVQMLLRAVQ